ncbi:MAG: bifunctional serine/threonine protein kinase/MFS transporter [Candidatus Eremiobacterota bacterium]
MELLPEQIIDEYKIIRPIGKGAMGNVYLSKKENNYYAIKESDTSSAEWKLVEKSFQKEAAFLAGLKHPGLPAFYKNFHIGFTHYIVMEYIQGKSLEDILSSGIVEEKKAVEWGMQICEILFYLHTLQPEPVIYRDLKPANIIITPYDTVRLIDFGVARRYDPSKNCDTIRLGTPGYAAPEQCRTKGQSTPRTDIYALGVMLHQLLTGHDPSVTPFKLPPLRTLNPAISEDLEWIIKKAINLDQRERYIDMGLFRDELLDYYTDKFGHYISPYNKSLPYLEDNNIPKDFSSSFIAEIPKSTNPLDNVLNSVFSGMNNLSVSVPSFISTVFTVFHIIMDHIGFKRLCAVSAIIMFFLTIFLPKSVFFILMCSICWFVILTVYYSKISP